ncbi:hypothetical protein BGK50_10280 (plasmid) [Shigella sp. FC130]|nr:hypothetical protein BGK50_10280 [Shigella sp. FC130]
MATSEWHLIMLALVLPTPAAKWFGRRATARSVRPALRPRGDLQLAVPRAVLRRGDRASLQLAALLRPEHRAVHHQRPDRAGWWD